MSEAGKYLDLAQEAIIEEVLAAIVAVLQKHGAYVSEKDKERLWSRLETAITVCGQVNP